MNRELAHLAGQLAPPSVVRDSRADSLAARLEGKETPPIFRSARADQLRVAAFTATSVLLGGRPVEEVTRTAQDDERLGVAQGALTYWLAWFREAEARQELPDTEDLVLFAAVALIGRRPVELRTSLSSPAAKELLAAGIDMEGDWCHEVQLAISRALLLVVRQCDHADLRQAAAAVESLAVLQRAHDPQWAKSASKRSALTALGMYHLAHATSRLSEFLLSGSVLTRGRPVRDFAAELQRLLAKAEEYIDLGGDLEVGLWLNGVAVVLWRLRTDSIWVGAASISPYVDRLLRAITDAGRERPIFTLLPSQHDALRRRLLDPAQVAIVLQMPTSAGKTLLAEFAIAQVYGAYGKGARIAYVCPTRALATQIRGTLTQDLGPIDIRVSAAGGAFEEDPYEIQLLTDTDGVAVATPEKLDLMLRAHPDWAAELRLVVVDEAHLLSDGERGVRLELLLANLRREQPQARLLLLTPFVTNANRIAEWLGEERGTPIEVHWRPSRLLLGAASFQGTGKNRTCTVDWVEPHSDSTAPSPLTFSTGAGALAASRARLVRLAGHFSKLGTVLGMFASSKVEAEKAATEAAEGSNPLPQLTPALRVAIAAAEHDYGQDCALARCLRNGIAFHHSSLSPLVRFLIEDQVRVGTIRFVAATTTLAQGMNFPVSTVLIHSVSKPNNGGRLSAAEFWNIAGRAGRVGFADEGLIVFVNRDGPEVREHYRRALNTEIVSALLEAVRQGIPTDPKEAYRVIPALQPFLQFVAHAVASLGYRDAVDQFEETLQSSLAFRSASGKAETDALRQLAHRYLTALSSKNTGLLKVADAAGLGSFSFDELLGKVRADMVLSAGPDVVLRSGVDGLRRLVDVLKWLPEMNLAVEKGEGAMDSVAVARVAYAWMHGEPVHAVAKEFTGKDDEERARKAGKYVYGKVASLLSWGAHAYGRSWGLGATRELSPSDRMLPAYLQFGVSTPEAAVASLLGVPRVMAPAAGALWRERRGALTPERVEEFKGFIEGADAGTWRDVVARSPWAGKVEAADVTAVARQLMGRSS